MSRSELAVMMRDGSLDPSILALLPEGSFGDDLDVDLHTLLLRAG